MFLASLFLNVRHYACEGSERVVGDTITVTVIDTISYLKPVPRDSVVVRYVTERLPVASRANQEDGTVRAYSGGDTGIEDVPEGDNISGKNIADSVEVEIPITQRVYCDSTYRAYVSGYRASLDSLILYPRSETVIISTPCPELKQKRWGIGIHAGYGICTTGTPRLSPYIGVGISYNIFSF